MTYRLSKLAPGSYDVILNGVIVGGLVRTQSHDGSNWTAELLVDLPPDQRPAPFSSTEHAFADLDEACRWLGLPGIPSD